MPDLPTEVQPASCEVARWELTRRIRSRRAELRVETQDILKALNVSRGRWSQIENDHHSMISTEAIARLQELLEFDDAEIKELIELRQAAADRRGAWWLAYGDLLDDEVLRYYGLEHGASRLRTYSPIIMVGHLQTEEYARALVGNHIDVSRVDVDRFVSLRMARQRRLEPGDPLVLEVVLTEATLRNELGSPAMLHRQLLHVAGLVDRMADRLQLRVLPFTAPLSSVAAASIFTLLDFPSPHLPSALWQETVRNPGLSEDYETVRYLELVYAEATELALSREDSQRLLIDTAAELKRRLP